MSQRNSGYDRQPSELYPTPAWVTDALGEHVSFKGRTIWEPAAGDGMMVGALEKLGAYVVATDIENKIGRKLRATFDFTSADKCWALDSFDGIVTNPPYGQGGRTAEIFIERGLARIAHRGFMALLLSVDFDSGSTREKFFRKSPLYAGKIVLTKRIKWFEPPPGEKSSGASANHSWYIWACPWLEAQQTPRVLYAPTWSHRRGARGDAA